MALDLKIDSGKIKKDMKIYLIYLLVVLIAAVLFIMAGNKLYTNFVQKRSEVEALESEISKLNTKVEALKNINQEKYTDLSVLSVTFPEEDPLLFAYSQLKKLALNSAVFVYDIGFSPGAEISGGLSKSSISFSVAGLKDRVTNFLTELIKGAPLSGFENISFDKYVGNDKAFVVDVSVNYYYSTYPKVISSIEGSVVPLSESEKKIYDEIVQLKVPDKYDIKPQGANQEKVDPFTEVGTLPQTTPTQVPEATPTQIPEVTPTVTPEAGGE